MTKMQRIVTLAAALGWATTASAEGYFDGKTNLLCSVMQLYECDVQNACMAVTPDQINGFTHLDLDFKKKLMTRAGEESPQLSPIEQVKTIDGKLFVQGIEDGAADVRDGAGWSISIMNPEGLMVLTAAADGFAVVALGACVPKPK